MGMSIFSELEDGVVAAGPDDMHRLAARLASVFPADGTLALQGDLGAGKTTFVKGLAAAWRVPEAVTSPSFTVCNLHRGDRLLVHVDAYRLSSPADWDGLLIEEFLVSPWCLVVEWPERLGDRLPPDALWLGIEIQPDLSRFVRVIKPPLPAGYR
jgi:tRNA threonylcarbamoyladenosine biosynthesis protein TsaE